MKWMAMISLAALAGCGAAGDSMGPTPATGLAAPSPWTIGDRAAVCLERYTELFYSIKGQEFGTPWKEPDTFAFYDRDKGHIFLAYLGGARTIDDGKERITARREVLDAALDRCEHKLGLRAGTLGDQLFVMYGRVDRKAGTVQDVVQYAEGKYDFPTDRGALSYEKWIPREGPAPVAPPAAAK